MDDECYIVDWDLPLSSERIKFYRALKRLRKRFQQHDMSTQSVLKTGNLAFAREVFELACVYGRANLYRVVKLNGAR